MYAARAFLQHSPIELCASNHFIFINFHTLCTQWTFATPFSSTTSALFLMQRRGEPLLDLSLAIGQSSLATVPKSFICHTSAKSATNSFPCHTSKIPLPQVLCLPHLRHPPPPTYLPPRPFLFGGFAHTSSCFLRPGPANLTSRLQVWAVGSKDKRPLGNFGKGVSVWPQRSGRDISPSV
jgi:hypothetical protein